MIIQFLNNSPWYAYVSICYVIFIGIQATKPRVVFLPKLFIMPIIILMLKYKKLLSLNFLYTLPPLFIGLLIECITGFYSKKHTYIKSNFSINLPGTYVTLIMFLSFFSIKYYLGFLQATQPNVDDYIYMDIAISCLFSGYSFRKATILTIQYFINNIIARRSESR